MALVPYDPSARHGKVCHYGFNCYYGVRCVDWHSDAQIAHFKENEAARIALLHNTKRCNRGSECLNGDACTFAHPPEERAENERRKQERIAQKIRTVPCRHFARGNCDREECDFLHSNVNEGHHLLERGFAEYPTFGELAHLDLGEQSGLAGRGRGRGRGRGLGKQSGLGARPNFAGRGRGRGFGKPPSLGECNGFTFALPSDANDDADRD